MALDDIVIGSLTGVTLGEGGQGFIMELSSTASFTNVDVLFDGEMPVFELPRYTSAPASGGEVSSVFVN